MNETDDVKELAQKAAAGDKTAFDGLYRETCRFVYFTCLNILKDEQEAQDVTQDVYLTAFEQLDTLKDVGKFRPWLYRIAANKSIKRLKKKQPILLSDEQLEDMETEENENFLPEKYALNADKRELVLDITRKVCTDTQYQTILLYYFNDLSIAEIAEIMECQENNVKKRLSIARTKIKEGVLRYEKKSGDRLYSVAPIPFLTLLFTAQMQDMQILLPPLSFKDAIPKSTLAAKTGRHIMLKSLQFKIAAGIVTAAVAVGGVTAAVVLANQGAVEASAGEQEGNTLNEANAGNTENIPELATQSTETEEPQETEAAEEPEISEEVKTEETTTPEETTAEPESAETTPEQTAAPEYTYTDMSATMYATQTVNIRTAPSTDGEKVGSLSTNQEIAITGQCNETSWYRFEYNGQAAYVSNNYVSDTKIEVAASEPAYEQSASSSESSGRININELPVSQWVDMGDWFYYIHPVWNERPPFSTIDPEYMDIVNTLQARYPDRKIGWGHGGWLKQFGVSLWFVEAMPTAENRDMYDTLGYYMQFSQLPNT